MQKISLLLLLTLLLTQLSAQRFLDQRITFGTSYTMLSLRGDLNTIKIVPNGRSTGHVFQNRGASAIGFNVGYGISFKNKVELLAQVSFSGNSVMDSIRNSSNISNSIDSPSGIIIHPRTYRGFWGDFIAYYPIFKRTTQVDIKAGLGVSYLIYTQHLLSGYSYYGGSNLVDALLIKHERRGVWGVPFHAKMQWHINHKWEFALNFHANFYEQRNVVLGMGMQMQWKI